MTEESVELGSIRRLENGFEGRLKRVIGHAPDQVWGMLTDSGKLAQWLAPGSIEPRQGGAVRIDFADSGIVIDSRVRAFEPGRLLEYSWSNGAEPARPLRWTLDALGQGTRLDLTVRLPAGEDIAKACAGFEGHLDMMLAALEGVPVRFPFELFLRARKAYQAQVDSLAG